MMTPVVNRENPMIERKKMMSRESSTPLVNHSKWVMTLNEATVSTSHGLSMRVSRFVTGGKPHSTRNKQMTNPSPALVTPAPESQATKLTNQVPRRSSVGDFLVEVGQVLGHAGVQRGECGRIGGFAGMKFEIHGI